MDLETMKLILGEYLPENLDLDRYELDKMTKDDDLDKFHPFLGKIELFFTEKNILPEEYKNNKDIISKGSFEYEAITDVLIRHKIGIIYIKKRKWYNKKTNKVIKSKNIEIKGIRTTPDNVFFYKDLMTHEKYHGLSVA